jgi:hypothetical protein
VSSELFVPEDFAVRDGLIADQFRLEPLGPQHNEADYAAWTSSVDHIRATPGFAGSSWPHGMTLQENLGDLERHARDFAERRGFTFTVLERHRRRYRLRLHLPSPRPRGRQPGA